MLYSIKDHFNAKAFVVTVEINGNKTTAATFNYEYGVSKRLIEMQASTFCTCMNNINNCTVIKLIG